MTKHSDEYRVAFLILAHDDIEMLSRLVDRLGPNDIFIHLDKKSNISRTDLDALPSNVTICENSIATYWADFSLVEATLELVKLAISTNRYNHLVLLSGHCYPIKPISQLKGYLDAHRNVNFMQLVHIRQESFLYRRLTRHWRNRPFAPHSIQEFALYPSKLDSRVVKIANRISKFFRRDFYKEIYPGTPFYGSQWWALTHETAVRLVYSGTTQFIKNYFKTTFAPDELFVQTVLGNILEPHEIVGPTTDRGHRTVLDAPLHLVVDVIGFWLQDTPETRRELMTGAKFFVRKVRSDQTDILDWIDANLLNLEGNRDD